MAVDIHFDDKKIKQQVSRILETQSFKSSNILSRFLYYIVSETLEGKGGSLKEYVIATNVLNRNTDFDPQLDAIVRIHARRLRNLLDEYYKGDGLNDPIKISVPKGRYVPVFKRNEAIKSQKTNVSIDIGHSIISEPVIAVIPDMNSVKNERVEVICEVFCRDLSVELSRFNEIVVVSNYSIGVAIDSLKNLDTLTNKLGIDYIISVSCYSDEDYIKVTVEVNSVIKKQLIWAESFNFDHNKGNRVKNYAAAIKKILGMIGGFFGLVYRDSLAQRIPEDFDHMYAVYWHNHYHKHFSYEAFQQSLKAVNIGLEKNPENSLLTSFKAQLFLDLNAMGIQGEIDYFAEGQRLTFRALDLDQNNQHAWMMLAWTNLLGKNKKEFIRSSEKCISINPNNVMYTGSIGFGYECAGEYEKGLEIMSESIKLNPYYFWNMNLGFCFYYLSHKEFEEAFIWAEKINRDGLVWDPLLRATCLGHLVRTREASKAIEELLKITPDFPGRAREIVGVFLLDQDLQDTIIEGLISAGISIAN
jgi:TolB-like protein